MGGGNSEAAIKEAKANAEFAEYVQKSTQRILDKGNADISAFFSTVDALLAKQSAIGSDEINKLQQDDQTANKNLQDAANQASAVPATAPAPTPKTDQPLVPDNSGGVLPPTTIVSHAPQNGSDIIVLLSQAAVFYSNSSTTDPALLQSITSTLLSTIQAAIPNPIGTLKPTDPPPAEHVTKADSANVDPNKADPSFSGATAPGQFSDAMKEGLKALFPEATMVQAALSGVANVANQLLSSLKTGVAASASTDKKIQFIAPGLYCAMYNSTFKVHYEGGIVKKTIDASMQCSGIYVVTSPALVKAVTTLMIYKTISTSFQDQMKLMQGTLRDFINAKADLAAFGQSFGFDEEYYKDIDSQLKTQVLKVVLSNFWRNEKDYSKDKRTNDWNTYVGQSDLTARVDRLSSAYQQAYAELEKYYHTYVEPLLKH